MKREWLSAGRMLTLAVLFAACSEHPIVTPGGSPESVLASRGGAIVSERRMNELLQQMTRSVATALADPDVRKQLYDALHASPYREHKIHFAAFLRGNGQSLLRAITAESASRQDRTQNSGAATNVVLAMLDSIVDLEFYMPVKKHLDLWDGSANLIVASALLDDGRTPDGFDLNGRPVALTASRPPTIPTLALVPVETDFSKIPSLSPAKSAGAVASEPGIFMTRAIVYEDWEGWIRGSPEFEVHVFQTDADDEYIDQLCAGEQQVPPYEWNDAETQEWTGEVQLATESRLAASPKTQFQMWEDDSDPCTPTGGRPPHTSSLKVSDYAAYESSLLAIASSGNAVALITSIVASIPVIYHFITAGAEDDEVGVLAVPATCWPGTNGVATNPVPVWIRSAASGHPITGSVLLDYRMSAPREPICPVSVVAGGASFTYEGSAYTWTANVSNGYPPYTYQWYRDGVPVETSQSRTETVFQPDFDLQVLVTDGHGDKAFSPRRVNVSNCTPPQKTC